MSNPFKHIQGEVSWKAPSNIALIKYWGKHGNQLPRNASFSFTLDTAYTETTIHYTAKQNDDKAIAIKFLFEGKEHPKFTEKIEQFLKSIVPFFPFLPHLSLTIHSHNSFPHSTGIASSASSMAALALCLTSIENELDGGLSPALFFEKASKIARLGSGSACPKPCRGLRQTSQTPDGEGRPRPDDTAVGCPARDLGWLRLLWRGLRRPAEGLRAAHLPRRAIHARQRGAGVPVVHVDRWGLAGAHPEITSVTDVPDDEAVISVTPGSGRVEAAPGPPPGRQDRMGVRLRLRNPQAD